MAYKMRMDGNQAVVKTGPLATLIFGFRQIIEYTSATTISVYGGISVNAYLTWSEWGPVARRSFKLLGANGKVYAAFDLKESAQANNVLPGPNDVERVWISKELSGFSSLDLGQDTLRIEFHFDPATTTSSVSMSNATTVRLTMAPDLFSSFSFTTSCQASDLRHVSLGNEGQANLIPTMNGAYGEVDLPGIHTNFSGHGQVHVIAPGTITEVV
jgi:hypothetical protein